MDKTKKTILFAVIVVAVLVFIGLTDNISEFVATIFVATEEEKIEPVPIQPVAPESAPPPPATVRPAPPPARLTAPLTVTLKAGDRGIQVQSLQNFLISQGFLALNLNTGFFGNLTQTAVIKFQESRAAEILTPNGLSSGTGIVGPATRRAISALTGGSQPQPPGPIPRIQQ